MFIDDYQLLITKIRKRIVAEDDVNKMLSLARLYGEMHRLNHSGVYSDLNLELLIEKNFLKNQKHINYIKDHKVAKTMVVVTEFYNFGGHSEVLKQWLKLFKNNHEVVISQFLSKEMKQWLDEEGVVYHLCHSKNKSLVLEIVALCERYSQAVMFTHPEDIVGSVAARLLSAYGVRIIFYNHADHVFSYGIENADVVCEISLYGMELNKRTDRVHGRSVYLGIPIDFSFSHNASILKKRYKTVLTCGAPYKYKPSFDSSFNDFIDIFLASNTHDRIVLVGSTGKEPWWEGKQKRWKDRVVFLGPLSRAEYQKELDNADVYVDSFPITGGVAFPEALLNNKKVAGLRSAVQGYSPVDQLRSASIADLVEKVNKLLCDDKQSLLEMKRVKAEVESLHSPSFFAKRVQGVYDEKYTDVMLAPVYVDTVQAEKDWALKENIKFPRGSTIHNLTLRQCFCFLFDSSRVMQWCSKKDMLKLLMICLIKPIPLAFINRLLGRS